MNWYFQVLRDYSTFTGRARRKEYWMFQLFHLGIIFLLAFLTDYTTFYNSYNTPFSVTEIILLIYFVGTFIPSLAVTVRRLHDTGRSGWFYFIQVVPYIGFLTLLYLMCLDSVVGPNKWGINPKGIGNEDPIDHIGTE